MKRSIRHQMKQMVQYALYILLAMLLVVPYTMLIGSGETRYYMMLGMAGMMTLMFLFLFPQTFYATNTNLAISFGDTRHNWFAASLLAKLAFTLVSVLGVVLAILPLGMLLFGQPVQFYVQALPIALSAGLLLVCLGSLLGYITLRYGAKWMMIVLLALFAAGIVFALMFMFSGKIELIFPVLQGPWAVIVALALCIPAELGEWMLLRRLAVTV